MTLHFLWTVVSIESIEKHDDNECIKGIAVGKFKWVIQNISL